MNLMSLRILLAAGLLLGLTGLTQAGVVPKIIGGGAAADAKYPFMAALVDPLAPKDFQAQFCGGTVIAARWVLTAAHCITRTSSGDVIGTGEIEVITGVTTLSNDVLTGATRIAVTKILRHPNFNSTTLRNDVALLYLASATAVDSNFAPDDGTAIGLATGGDDLTAIGWGVVDQNGTATTTDDSFSATLQEVLVDYIPFATCNSNSYYAGDLSSETLCAGFLAGTPRDTCFGDSGGPLLRDMGGGVWRQVGITSFSFGDFCAVSSEPGIYVDASQFHGYITGAPTQADLRVQVSTVPGSQIGNDVTARISVANLSPANAATGASLSITLTGETAVTNLAALPGCTGAVTGPLTCDLGTLAANGSLTRDIALTFTGLGLFTITATASSTAGDYYGSNNTGTREYNLVPPSPTPTGGGGGSIDPAALFALFALLTCRFVPRRPHAPHHSLRLRQLLRIG